MTEILFYNGKQRKELLCKAFGKMARIVLNASMKTTLCVIVNCYDIENYTQYSVDEKKIFTH